ncbi:MAG: hypothetical protein LBG62_01525 [Candidatus Methanoplasma sp.]|jgi:predicted transglutaminase-like cysteine proteinase|nr:hypothetical protein [Candidatus Methanoplasma sp.]
MAFACLSAGAGDGRGEECSVAVYKAGEGEVTGEGAYRAGDTVRLSAVPGEGRLFAGWYEGDSLLSMDPLCEFEASSDVHLTARFEEASYRIEALSADPSMGGVSGGGIDARYGEEVALSAVPAPGYLFEGWKIGGATVSISADYSHAVTGDAEITGTFGPDGAAAFLLVLSRDGGGAVVSAVPAHALGGARGEWAFRDFATGEEILRAQASDEEPGASVSVPGGAAVAVTYAVTPPGGATEERSKTAVIDSEEVKRFSWRYREGAWYSAVTDFLRINNKSASLDLKMEFGWYYGALASGVARSEGYGEISGYVDGGPAVAALARELSARSSGMSDLERVGFALRLVQSVPYADDWEKGASDYWKLPAETLWEQRGDCEDHAFLFAALMREMGYGVVVHYVFCYGSDGGFKTAHMAVGVDVPGGSGSFAEVDGARYYYCETTDTGSAGWLGSYGVGDVPGGYVVKKTYVV